MSKHTPGPWRISIKPAGRGSIPFIEAKGEDQAIAQIFGGDRTAEERAANANLIAAAPDLLMWAKDLADRWSDEIDVDTADTVRMLRKAIARAEGRA